MRNLTGLLAFVRVLDAGSFTEAARRAGTTPSAMSKAVGRLERAHNVKLLHRTTHALSATAEGARVAESARALLRSAEHLQASLAEAGGGVVSGRVRLSAPGAFARACLLPDLAQLLGAHPGLEVEISFNDALAELGGEGFDLALRTGSLHHQPGLISRQLVTYPMVLCATPAYLARRGMPASVADLAGHDLIGFRNRATGLVMPWVFAQPEGGTMRLLPPMRLVVDDGTAGWAMLRDGLGLTWAPTWLGLDDLRSGRVVEVMRAARVPEHPLSVIRLGGRHLPGRTRAVLAWLRTQAARWSLSA